MGGEFILDIERKVSGRLKSFERGVSVRQAQLGEFSGVYGALRLLETK
jgi:hypothetical protein